jgi:NAD-dependent deacetylase
MEPYSPTFGNPLIMSHAPLKKLVVLTGAGISAESGLKTFRDSDGLWNGHRIEDVATPEAWQRNPEKVLDFYNERRRGLLQAKPNAAHEGLVKLESMFDVHIITQNVDDLHERAGSNNVLHLHGELLKVRSESNPDLVYETSDDIFMGQKASDGAQLRPDIVWFGESVPRIEEAYNIVSTADIFVIIGTSLQVYPAAGLIDALKNSEVPVFVIDRQIPPVATYIKVKEICMNASDGVNELIGILC